MRVLAYTSPARGHLYPIVPIMASLAARGHECVVYTLAEELQHLQALGILGRAIDPLVERNQIEDWRERLPHRAALSTLRTFLQRAERDGPDLARAIALHDPDVLLIDILSWGAAAEAERSGRRWAMYCPFLMGMRSRDTPPFGPGLRPLSGPLGHARDTAVRRMADAVTDRVVMRPLDRMRADYGLTALEHFDRLGARAPLLLGLTAEGFEYQRSDWPANVRLVGAVNWSPPQHEPGWLDEISDPLVLVTCSTERQRDKRLAHVALEALPARGLAAIVTSAAHDPSEFSAPAGSRVLRFLSHEAVLRRAACVVCHGGMGITQKALAAGVPVVVVPFARDQFETARRVEHAQAGTWLSSRRLTPERLGAAVQQAMGMRAGAARVSAAYAAAGGERAAADAIEALARDGER